MARFSLTSKNSSSYIPELDGLRFIAIAGVLIGHFTMATKIKEFTSILSSNGVNLFFVLSGFLISQILYEGKKENSDLNYLKVFYIRRFLRIFPLYYFILVLTFALNIPGSRDNFYWLFFYLGNIKMALSHGQLGYLGHLWSLSVEEQFYIFFPIIIYFLPIKRIPLVLGILFGLAIGFRILIMILIPSPKIGFWYSYTLTPGCLDSFAIGAYLAYLKIFNFQLLQTILKQKWIFFIIAFGAIILVFFNIT